MQMESWVGTIEREWHQLRRADPTLDVEKFSRHVIAANKTGFLSPESLAAIANALLTSTLARAPHLGRWLLERIGANRHPAWRMAMAISLVTPTGGEADLERGNAIFEDVMQDETADGHLRGMAAAALADSARLGRGMPVDVSRARSLYEQAITLGHKASAHNLGLYWEGAWGAEGNSVTPTAPRRYRPIGVVEMTYVASAVSQRCGEAAVPPPARMPGKSAARGAFGSGRRQAPGREMQRDRITASTGQQPFVIGTSDPSHQVECVVR